MIDRSAIRGLLRRPDDRFARVCEFNSNPSVYSDRSHFVGMIPADLLDATLASPRGHRRLSTLLLDRGGLREKVCFDFEETRRRFALVDGGALQRLRLIVGAAVQAERIARVIERGPLQRLKDQIGERVYEFALKRARFLVPRVPASLRIASGDLSLDVRESGRLAIETCLLGEPEAITGRFALKFPAETCWDFSRKIAAPEQQETWQFVHRVFLKEVGAEWSVCLS